MCHVWHLLMVVKQASDPAIIIGTFQFEDNFLLFDLENLTLGFNASLLHKGTSCGNFNFTMGGSGVLS